MPCKKYKQLRDTCHCELQIQRVAFVVDTDLLVSEDEIINAMRIIWERMKIIIEPSCAVPLAALIKHKEQFKGKRIGIIITGGNVDLGNLPF